MSYQKNLLIEHQGETVEATTAADTNESNIYEDIEDKLLRAHADYGDEIFLKAAKIIKERGALSEQIESSRFSMDVR